MNPGRILNEYEGWMNCIRIRIFVLSCFVPTTNFLTELLSTFQKLSTHGISSAHTAWRIYFTIAHKNSSWVVPLLHLLASPYSTYFKQNFSLLDNKWLQERLFRTLAAFETRGQAFQSQNQYRHQDTQYEDAEGGDDLSQVDGLPVFRYWRFCTH